MDLSLPAIAALFSACTWGIGSLMFSRVLAHPDVGRRPGAFSACMVKNLTACTAFILAKAWRQCSEAAVLGGGGPGGSGSDGVGNGERSINAVSI